MQVLQLITQARLNLSADSSPLVAELLHDSAAYFDNPSQSWVWQTPPEFLLELPSPEEWLPHAYASLVEHPPFTGSRPSDLDTRRGSAALILERVTT